MIVLTLLEGGPEDGKVVDSGGGVPTLLLSQPRTRSLLDEPKKVAVWNEEACWYEEERES